MDAAYAAAPRMGRAAVSGMAVSGAAAGGEVATRFAALLFEQVFKPLAAPLGFYGDAALAAVSKAVARSDRDGLAARLDRLVEDASR